MTADAAPRRSVWARLRADLRLARRQVWRAKGSSALVMLLVALPVAGLAGAAVTVQSHVPTRAQQAELELGRTQAWLMVAGGADPSRVQAPDQPYDSDVARTSAGEPVNPPQPEPTDPSAALPAGTRTIELTDPVAVFVKTATGVGEVLATAGPAWDPAFTGRYTVVDGSRPTGEGQAMVTPGMLGRLGATIGDRVTLADSGTSYTITGTMRRLDQSASDQELYLPASAAALLLGRGRWYTPDWQPTAADLPRLNHAGFVVYGRDLVTHPPQGAGTGDSSSGWIMLMVGSVIAVFCGYLVVLLAGAAFAVAARRQQRSLAVAGSVGATRADMFRIVVLQGTVLGTLGGAVGAAAGIGLAALFLGVTDNGVVGSFWGNWGFQVPWALVAGILAFAVIVGTLAALVPARTATKGDILGALRGARRPARLDPKRPLWGLALMILGIAGTVGGGVAIAAMNLQQPVDYANPLRTLAMWAVVLSPVVFQVGILFAGHWVLVGVARAASKLGMAPRLASRDAAANPSRVIPAFAAIAVCVFLASFALSLTATTSAASARNYSWGGPLGSVQVWAWQGNGADAAQTQTAMESVLAPSGPTRMIAVAAPPDAPVDTATGEALDPGFPVWAATDRCKGCAAPLYDSGAIAVVDPDDLETLLDTRIPAATLAAVRNGAALDVAQWSHFTKGGQVKLSRWVPATFDDYQQHFYAGTPQSASLPQPEQTVQLPGVTLSLDHPQGPLQLIISPATAQLIGMTVVPRNVIAVYPAPASDATVDAVTAAAQNVRIGERGTLQVLAERGPAPADLWLWLILAVAGVLVIGASAVSLGLARFERRPDDATLAAVGAGRRVRRHINAWQAVIIAGIGTVVGTVAGLIPMWGIAQSSSDGWQFVDIPWGWLAILAAGLPAVVALVSWLVPPRHPDLTRRTAIA